MINSHFTPYTNLTVYEKMAKDFTDFQKLLNSIKTLLETQLKRQESFLSELHTHSSLFTANLSCAQKHKDIERKIARVPESQTNLGAQLKNVILTQHKELIHFCKESLSQVTQFHKFLAEYIVNNVKAYKNEESSFKDSYIRYQQSLNDYATAVDRYRRSLEDANLIYNISERAQRYKQIQHVIKMIRESESQLRISVQLINTRRKTLCVDLIELRKISEDALSSIQSKFQKLLRKFTSSCSGSLQVLLLQLRREQKNEQGSRHYSTVIPEWTKFNFTSEYEPTPNLGTPQISSRAVSRAPDLIPNEISSVSDNRQRDDWSTIRDEFDNMNLNSFYSVREDLDDDTPILTHDMLAFSDQFPHFLTYPQNISPQNLIHFPEWVMAYCKQIQENCQSRIGQIKVFHNYLDLLIRISKTLKATISLQDNIIPSVQNLPWYSYLKSLMGNYSCTIMEELVKQQDGQVQLLQSLAQFLLQKLQVLARLGIDLQKQQAIAFSGLNHQIQELNQHKLNFLKSEGLVIKNRTISLQRINQNFLNYDEQTASEVKFRNAIDISCKTITQLLSELREQDTRAIKSISDIVDNFQRELCSQLGLLVDLVSSLNQYTESQVINVSREHSIKFLKSHTYFKLLYLQSPNNQPLLEHGVSSDLDLRFTSQFDISVYRALPKPNLEQQESQESLSQIDQSDIIQDTDRKELEKQLLFIGTKVPLEINEHLLNSFSCALAEKMLLQGRLYITSKRLFFHSSFNSNNLFFGDTTLNIPKNDIIRIQKKTNAYIFDNSISLTTPKGQLFFTSFFHRDMAYNLIIKTFSPKEQPELVPYDQEEQQTEGSFQEQESFKFSDHQLQQILERSARIENSLPSDPKILVADQSFEIPSITVRKFFKAILSDDPVPGFPNRFAKIKSDALGCTDFRYREGQIQDVLLGLLILQSNSIIFKGLNHSLTMNLRQVVVYLLISHHCRNQAYLLCQKQLSVKKNIRCKCENYFPRYFVSLDRIVFDMIVQTYKAPYSDSFHCRVRYEIIAQPVGVKMSVKIELIFVKTVLVRKAIELATVQATQDSTRNLLQSIQKELALFSRKNNNKKSQQTVVDETVMQDQTPSFDGGPSKVVKGRKFIWFFFVTSLFLIIIITFHQFGEKITNLGIKAVQDI